MREHKYKYQYQSSLLLLNLVAIVMAHRDGARSNESCYNHDVVHVQIGVPPTTKIFCIRDCMYNLTLHGEVNEIPGMVIDTNVTRLKCSSTYQCT